MKSKNYDLKMDLLKVQCKIEDFKNRRDKLVAFDNFIQGRHSDTRKKAIAVFNSILLDLEQREKFLNERILESGGTERS